MSVPKWKVSCTELDLTHNEDDDDDDDSHIRAYFVNSSSPVSGITVVISTSLCVVVKGDEYISLINQQTAAPVIGTKTACVQFLCVTRSRQIDGPSEYIQSGQLKGRDFRGEGHNDGYVMRTSLLGN